MPKRSSKKPQDINEIAARAVGELTEVFAYPDTTGKNPAAVALGRLGGLKGGKARAEKLNSARRKQIARKAAKARWKGKAGSR